MKPSPLRLSDFFEVDLSTAQKKIRRIEDNARTAVRASTTHANTIRNLTEEVARQRLVITAMTRLLVSKNLVTESEVLDFIRQVNADDEVIDGKLRTGIEKPAPPFRPATPHAGTRPPPPPPLNRTKAPEGH